MAVKESPLSVVPYAIVSVKAEPLSLESDHKFPHHPSNFIAAEKEKNKGKWKRKAKQRATRMSKRVAADKSRRKLPLAFYFIDATVSWSLASRMS